MTNPFAGYGVKNRSGHFGHKGIPGVRGGSLPRGSGAATPAQETTLRHRKARYQIGITSARPGKSDEQIIKEMDDFVDKMEATSVENLSVELGRGGWDGGSELTYVTQYEGNGEGLKALAEFGKKHKQEAVLVQRYTDKNDPDAQPQNRWVFDEALDASEMGRAEETLVACGIGGWTWVQRESNTILMATCIPQWGGEKSAHLQSCNDASSYLSDLGSYTEEIQHVATTLMTSENYDAFIRGEISASAVETAALDPQLLNSCILITVDNKQKVDTDNLEGIRELEADFGPGVHALWDSERETIIGFAFEKGTFTPESAKAWVEAAYQIGQQKTAVGATFFNVVVDEPEPVSHGWLQPDGTPVHLAATKTDDGKTYGPSAYLYVPDPEKPSTWKIRIEETPGQITVAQLGRAAAAIGPKGFRGNRAQLPAEDRKRAVSRLISLYHKLDVADEDIPAYLWGIAGKKPPVKAAATLYAFMVGLGAADAEDSEDDLIWKEVLHPGEWSRMDSGKRLSVTSEMIEAAYQAFQDGLPKYVSVPADHHHGATSGVVPVTGNHGFVKELKLADGHRLFAGFKFTDPETQAGVENGSIADCSVYLEPNVVHPSTGERYSWALRHILLTNNPLIQDLDKWGVIAASGGETPLTVEIYDKEEIMSEVQLSAEEAQRYEAITSTLEKLGLEAADIEAMAEERQHVQAKARGLEIQSILEALEGKGEHSNVVALEGYRHYPVVVEAVKEALEKQPEALALSADAEGHTALDVALLDVVNAIPQEGRVALSQPTAPKEYLDSDGERRLTDEQVEELAKIL